MEQRTKMHEDNFADLLLIKSKEIILEYFFVKYLNLIRSRLFKRKT